MLDATNYYAPRDGVIPAVEGDRIPTSVHVQRALLGAHVVKAFNHILCSDAPADARPSDAPDRREIAVAGEDMSSKQRVIEFVNKIGGDPVDIGALTESWRIQLGIPG